MTDESVKNFGKRKAAEAASGEAPSRKRSGQIALLLMGTMAVGGGAYALMPHENCDPTDTMTTEQRQACQQRRSSSWSSSGGHGYYGGSSEASASSSSTTPRSNFASTGSLTGSSSGSLSSSSSSSVSRGGFGSFAAHFSGGG